MDPCQTRVFDLTDWTHSQITLEAKSAESTEHDLGNCWFFKSG